MSDAVKRARVRLIRALQEFERYDQHTYGRRDAVHIHIPNAVEELARAVAAEVLREQDKDAPVVDWKAIKEPNQ